MTKTEIARKLIKKMPGVPARTLARRLRQDYPDIFSSIENARSIVRKELGVKGKAVRKLAKSPREPRAAGWKPEFPPTDATPYAPHVLAAPGVVLSLSDLHVPYHDKRAIETAVRYAKRRHRVTTLLLNGDYGDFYSVSRFQRNPTKRNFRGEIDKMREGLAWLAKQFPKADRVYKLGNHDNWWDHWVWNHAPELADCEHMRLEKLLGFADLGYARVDDQPVMAGKLPIFHGHELGRGMTSPVNPARGAFTKTHHSCMVAHHHQTSTHVESDVFGKETAVWSQGCLCNLTPEYARVNKFNHGYAAIEVAKDSTYNVFNYRLGAGYEVRQS